MSTQTMAVSTEEVVRAMCEAYAAAVNANDSLAYSRLFTAEAVRMPPGSEPEYGPDQIRRGEQADYDVATWSIRSTPGDALRIADEWIYAIAHVDGTKTGHADGAKSSFQATKTWLLQRQSSGEWLIARQMWNLKPPAAPALDELKQRHQRIWDAGAYEPLVPLLRDLHERFLEHLAPRPGERLLDVATGTGAIALGAARAGARVTGLDISPSLIDTARRLAKQEGLEIRFDVGDAEDLPYADASFDAVCSCIGVMFAPHHETAARELARVCRPGGRLLLASWGPKGGVAEHFDVLRPFQPPPPAGVGNPFHWGEIDHVTNLLGDTFELELVEGETPFEAESGEELTARFEQYYGPQKTLMESLPPGRAAELHRAMVEHFEGYRTDGGISRPNPYLVVLGTRRPTS